MFLSGSIVGIVGWAVLCVVGHPAPLPGIDGWEDRDVVSSRDLHGACRSIGHRHCSPLGISRHSQRVLPPTRLSFAGSGHPWTSLLCCGHPCSKHFLLPEVDDCPEQCILRSLVTQKCQPCSLSVSRSCEARHPEWRRGHRVRPSPEEIRC